MSQIIYFGQFEYYFKIGKISKLAKRANSKALNLCTKKLVPFLKKEDK